MHSAPLIQLSNFDGLGWPITDSRPITDLDSLARRQTTIPPSSKGDFIARRTGASVAASALGVATEHRSLGPQR